MPLLPLLRVNYLVAGFLGVCALVLLVMAGLDWGRTGPLQPLVARANWKITGQFFPLGAPVDQMEVPLEALASPQIAFWRSWSPKTNSTVGAIASAPFALPRYIAVPFYGFPGVSPDNRVFIRCMASGAELDVSLLRTNTQWATEYLDIPPDFCPTHRAYVVAQAGPSKRPIAVGTPFKITAALYRVQTGFAARAVVIVGTMLILAGLFGSFAYQARRLTPNALWQAAAGYVGIGVAGMLVLACFTVSRHLGRPVSIVVSLSGVGGLVYLAVRDRSGLKSLLADHGSAIAAWSIVALVYAAFASAADSGGGSWAVNGLFTPLGWSSDNQLPFMFSEALYGGAPGSSLVSGTWLATDRTPLLGTLLLLLRRPLIQPLAYGFGSTFVPTAYMMAGITIISVWAGVLWSACRRLCPEHAFLVLLLAAAAPFCFFNTLYSWGKLLGGAYVFLAFAVLYDLRREEMRNIQTIALVAVAAMLAILAHGGNFFALLPLAAIFARTILRQGVVGIVIATAIAVVIYLPWLYWQVFIQPNGNALTRYALAGEFGFDHRTTPVIDSVMAAYARLGVVGWLYTKFEALMVIFGISAPWATNGEVATYSPGAGWLGASRVADFYVAFRTVGVALVGILVLPFIRIERPLTPDQRLAAAAVGAGLASLAFTLLVTLSTPITHQLPYGSILLLTFGGALVIATLPETMARTVTAIYLTYFAVVWLYHPLSFALRLHGLALAACVVLLLLAPVWMPRTPRTVEP